MCASGNLKLLPRAFFKIPKLGSARINYPHPPPWQVALNARHVRSTQTPSPRSLSFHWSPHRGQLLVFLHSAHYLVLNHRCGMECCFKCAVAQVSVPGRSCTTAFTLLRSESVALSLTAELKLGFCDEAFPGCTKDARSSSH